MRKALQIIWKNPYVKAFTLIVSLIILFFFFSATRGVWGTFLGAFLLAYLLYPLLTWLEKRSLPRFIGMLLIVMGCFLLIGVFAGIGALLANELPNIAPQLINAVGQFEDVPYLISRFIDPSFGLVFREVSSAVENFLERLFYSITPNFQNDEPQGGLMSQLVALMGGGFRLVMTLILAFYIFYRFKYYSENFTDIIPARHQPTARRLLDKVGYSVGGYLRGQLIIAIGVGLLSFLGLALVGVPLALPLGLLATVLNLIPFFGPLLVSFPAVLLALTVGWGAVIGAISVLLIVNQLDAHVFTPLVFSKTIKVNPVTVIFAILLGSSLFGLWGAVLAVPLAVFIKFLYAEYYLASAWYQAD